MALRILTLLLFCSSALFSDHVRSIKTETVGKLHNTFNDFGLLIRSHSSDGSIDYSYEYSEEGIEIHNRLTKETLIQQINENGQVIYEKFPSGLEISVEIKNSHIMRLSLPDGSGVEYRYKGNNVDRVVRVDRSGKPLYRHTYTQPSKHEIIHQLIGSLGQAHCLYNENTGRLSVKTPSGEQLYKYDENRNLISKKIGKTLFTYSYTEKGELVAPLIPECQCIYDEYGRMISKNG